MSDFLPDRQELAPVHEWSIANVPPEDDIPAAKTTSRAGGG